MQQTDRARGQRIGVGRVELVPEQPALRLGTVRANAADAACRVLFLAVLLAQAADTLTTTFALHQSGAYEINPATGVLAMRPALALAVKLGAVVAVCLIALVRLPVQRARVALTLAFALSIIAPVLNLATLWGH